MNHDSPHPKRSTPEGGGEHRRGGKRPALVPWTPEPYDLSPGSKRETAWHRAVRKPQAANPTAPRFALEEPPSCPKTSEPRSGAAAPERGPASRPQSLAQQGGLVEMERETGIEPATNGLEGRDSTTELLPPDEWY